MQFVGTKQDLIAELKRWAEAHRSHARTTRMNKSVGGAAVAKHHDSVAHGMEYAISMLDGWTEPGPKELIEFKD